MNRKLSVASCLIAIAFVFLLSTSFFSFAATQYTVTVQASPSSSPSGSVGTPFTISGTVTPAPGVAGAEITIEITAPSGSTFLNSTAVNANTGAYSVVFYSGPVANGWSSGTYNVEAIWADSPTDPSFTATTTFTYGSATTTSTTSSTTTSSSATPTTVTTTVTSTTTATSTSTSTATSTVTSTATSTVSTTSTQTSTVSTTITGPTVTTVSPTTISTTVTGPTTTSTTTAASITWVAIGVGGVVAAIILGGVAALMARRR